jgi:hypothetical protein
MQSQDDFAKEQSAKSLSFCVFSPMGLCFSERLFTLWNQNKPVILPRRLKTKLGFEFNSQPTNLSWFSELPQLDLQINLWTLSDASVSKIVEGIGVSAEINLKIEFETTRAQLQNATRLLEKCQTRKTTKKKQTRSSL